MLKKRYLLALIGSLILGQSVFADMDTTRNFTAKNGDQFKMNALYSQTCKKGNEVVTYTMFEASSDDLFGCALTYHYSKKGSEKSDFMTDRLINYSTKDDDVCLKRLKPRMEKVKKLGFTCDFSGIG